MKKKFLLLVACMALAMPLKAQDVTKPVVSYVSSRGDSGTVVVVFSEPVDPATASTKTNYTINNSVVVLNAKLALGQKSVILATTTMNDVSYTLTVMNVKDAAANVMVTSDNIFTHKNSSTDVVAYYQLDSVGMQGSDTLIYDATANTNNGKVKNGPVISEGFLGNAMSFDGVDDYVQFDSTASFNINGSAVSISLWTNLTYLPTELPGAFGPLFDSETDNYVLYEDKGNKELRFKATTSGGAARPGIPNAHVKKGEWINVVGVYDGANASIYLNGVLEGTLPLTGTVNIGQKATLGKSGTSYLSGKIDNVIVFNRALTVAEIIEMMPPSLRPQTKDSTPPVLVTGLTVTKSSPYVNDIVWSDVPNEKGSVYNVYFSNKTFTNTSDAGVVQLLPFNIKNGIQAVTHILRSPVTDQDVTYYYGITAKDSAFNINLPAIAGPFTNKAKGTPVIAMALANFTADGLLTEWTTAGVQPFIINPFRTGSLNAHSVFAGGVADSADLSAKAYLAMDANNLYVAFDVVDDTVSIDTANVQATYAQDSPDLNIGLYDSKGMIHTGYNRGGQPDHMFRFSLNRLNNDHGGPNPIVMYPGVNYIFKKKTLTPGYIVEARMPFTVLQALYAGDTLFAPKVGMTIPIDFSVNDRDGKTGTFDREGLIAYSNLNNNSSWVNQHDWSYSWYGAGPTGVQLDVAVVSTFELSQNYPNPFNPTTNIKFSIPQSGNVSLKLFDILGREVMTILNQFQEAGSYTATLDASKLATGMYMYKLESGSFSSVKKMMLIK